MISLALIVGVGTAGGHGWADRLLAVIGRGPVRWEQHGGGFETLVAATAPVFWFFFLLTGLSVFVLRRKDRARERPFRVPFYPLTPVLFCAMCAYMLWSSLAYARDLALLAIVPLLCGVPLYAVSRMMGARINGRRHE